MKKILIYVAIWLVVVNVFGFAAMNRFNLTPDTSYTWISPESFPVAKDSNLIDMHNRWDTFWYLDIVNNGYYLKTDNTLSNVVFFPLFPALIKIVGTILLGNYILAGWIISMSALFGACALFYKFVKEFHPDIDPELPVLLMLIFPTAFFFNVVYTESTFLFITIATFYFCFKKKYYKAAIFSLLGALTHSNGVFLALPILWKIAEDIGVKKIFLPKNWKQLVPVLFAPFGMFLFLAYDYVRFHDLFLFFKIESAWGRSFSINWDHFSTFSHPSIINLGIDSMLTIFVLTVLYLVYRKLSPLYAAFMSLTILAALTSGTLMSIGRYTIVLFPVFILLAKLGKYKDKTALFAWSLVSVLFFALDITLWVNNYWAG